MDLINKAASGAWSVVGGTMSVIFSIVSWLIVLLYMFFILLDFNKLSRGFKAAIPAKYRRMALRIFGDVADTMSRYFRGQAAVSFFVGVIFAIEFYIIGLPMAIAFGMFVGLLNMVPYLQLIGFIPAILLAIVKAADTGQSFWLIMLMLIIVFCVVQLIQDTFLTPKIMGKVMGLNAAIILLSLSIWGSLLGMLGMIIALPLTTLLLTYYQRYVIKKEQKQAAEKEE